MEIDDLVKVGEEYKRGQEEKERKRKNDIYLCYFSGQHWIVEQLESSEITTQVLTKLYQHILAMAQIKARVQGHLSACQEVYLHRGSKFKPDQFVLDSFWTHSQHWSTIQKWDLTRIETLVWENFGQVCLRFSY